MKLIITNNKVCDIPLPDPIPKKRRDLSIISANKEPITKDIRLNSYFFFICGISKISKGIVT